MYVLSFWKNSKKFFTRTKMYLLHLFTNKIQRLHLDPEKTNIKKFEEKPEIVCIKKNKIQ